MDTKTQHQRLYGAVWLWCTANGYSETPHRENAPDAVFESATDTIGFVFEPGRSNNEWLSLLKIAEQSVTRLYIVTDDNAKYRALTQTAPNHCGIFCVSDPYRLGMTSQMMQMATAIAK